MHTSHSSAVSDKIFNCTWCIFSHCLDIVIWTALYTTGTIPGQVAWPEDIVTRLYDLMSAGGTLQRQTAMPEWLIKVHSCIVRRNWDPMAVKFVHIKVVHYSLVTHMTQILVFRCFSWNYRNRHSTIHHTTVNKKVKVKFSRTCNRVLGWSWCTGDFF